MKTMPPGLAASLASGVTTLCRCWIVTRADGLRLGFTDHDEDLTVEGVTCSAESGATGTALEQGTGLSPDSLEIVGALTSGRLAESELARGLFDGAAVAVWRVDWASPADRVLVLSGTIGEVSRGPTAFTAEVTSPAAGSTNAPATRSSAMPAAGSTPPPRRCAAAARWRRCGAPAA